MRTVSRRSTLAVLAAVAAAFAAPSVATASDGQIIVKYAPGADARDQSEARDDADVVRDESLPLPRTELVTPQDGTSVGAAVADLERSPDVAYAEPDQPRRAFDLYPDEARFDATTDKLAADSPFTNLWALDNEGQAVGDSGAGTPHADIRAPAAWDVTTGSSDLTVAVVDSGVDRTHPDLFANLAPGWDFAYDDADPTDFDGHGTHVSGTIAARGNNGVGVTGVAWQTSLMPVQALDATGSGGTSDIVDAYRFAADHGARIVNASFGGSGFSQTEYDAIKAAKDVLFVVAAGNSAVNDDNASSASYPCAYDLPNILCVAATDNADHLAWFSNYGRTSVDIAAPGVDIYSTMRCGSYETLSGTSMATPEVSGAAALVLAHRPELKPADVRTLLMASADRLPRNTEAMRIASGGRLDVARALGVPDVTPPMSGTIVSDTTGAGTTTPDPAPTHTFAAPRIHEPAAPAPACPSAPVRTVNGGSTSPAAPATPVTTTTPVAPAPASTPVAHTPAPATVDRTAPSVIAAVARRGGLKLLLAGRLKALATTSERATVRFELRLAGRTAKRLHLAKSTPAAVRIGSGTATLTKAGTKRGTVRLTSAAKRALARVLSLKVMLRATATDAAGNARTRSRTVTLTR